MVYFRVSRVARSWRRVGELMPAQVSLLRTKSGERLSQEMESGLGRRAELSQAGCSLAIREIGIELSKALKSPR